MSDLGQLDMTKTGHNVVYANNDYGKSTFMSYVVENVPNQRVAIIDYHNEYTKLDHMPNVDRYVPTAKERNNPVERKEFLRWALRKIKKNKYDVIIIDEFNQYVHHSKFETPYELEDLKNNIAHDEWNAPMAFYVMRTPAQGDSEFRETARYVITGRCTGSNAQSALNEICDGLGDIAGNLHSHYFAIASPARYFWISEPVPEDKSTAKR